MRFFWGCSLALTWLSCSSEIVASEIMASASYAQSSVAGNANLIQTASPTAATALARKHRKPAPPVVHDEIQNKTVVPEGGAKEPPEQIAPGLSPEEREHERREAEQWLSATDNDLRILADRHLSPPRQDSVKQVRFYLADARSALKEGDFKRAHTLALKAHLLTDDMVKH